MCGVAWHVFADVLKVEVKLYLLSAAHAHGNQNRRGGPLTLQCVFVLGKQFAKLIAHQLFICPFVFYEFLPWFPFPVSITIWLARLLSVMWHVNEAHQIGMYCYCIACAFCHTNIIMRMENCLAKLRLSAKTLNVDNVMVSEHNC